MLRRVRESEPAGAPVTALETTPASTEPADACAARGAETEDGAAAVASGTSRRIWQVLVLHAGVVALLLAVSLVAWWRVWVTGHPTTSITCQCGDVAQGVWFMAWTPWAVTHGHSPLLTNAMFAGQGGANMLVNTSWIALSLVFAPVTWLFGPIASFNAAALLAPVVSGWAFFFAARAVSSFVPGQVLGSLLWGCSPFVLGGLPVGHFNLSVLFFPPLAFLALYDLCATNRHRPVVIGVLLGLLTVVQFFTGTELLAITAVGAAIGSLVAVGLAPRQAWARRRRILTGLAVAGGLSAVLLAYPLWFAVAGPRHIVGYPWPQVPSFGSAPSWTWNAGTQTHHVAALGRLGGDYGPAGLPAPFLGVGLVALLGGSVLAWWRRRLAIVLVVVGFACWLCSLGTKLHAASLTSTQRGGTAHWWLPWRALQHVPLLADVFPTRMSVMTTLCAAVLLVVALDAWWELGIRLLDRRRAPVAGHRRRRRRPRLVPGALFGLGLTALAVASLVPIARGEPLPFTLHSSGTPAWFTAVAPRLGPATVVLVLPNPSSGQVPALAFQAEHAMQISLVGGYAIVPGRDGRHSANVMANVGAEPLLNALSAPFETVPPPTPTNLALVRAALVRWRVGVVVVLADDLDPPRAVAYMTAVLGRPPLEQHGAFAWDGIGHHAPLAVTPAAYAACSAWNRSPALAGPCMMAAAATG